jgi:leucyl aminopeptidase
MPDIVLNQAAVTSADTDAVVVTAFEHGLSQAAKEADVALDGLLAEMRDAKEISGEFGECTSIRTMGRMPARQLLVLGLGKPAQLDSFRLHNAYQFAGSALRSHRASSATVFVDQAAIDAVGGNGTGGDAGADALRDVATGLLLANFEQGTRKSKPDERPALQHIAIGGISADGALGAALDEAQVLAQATNQVRSWASAPANTLTPTMLAASATTLYEGTGLEVEVLDKADLEKEGMGALLGVARGSDEPPVMITVRYEGGRPDGPRLALVGKGITFDTGGISIKPAAGMEMMKYDMGGGAAVLAAMWAIAKLRPAANVIGVVPATENMPGGRAYKPGDVLTSLSGKTIEVLNTDAEGRIILADGLAKARRMGATHIVDVATLTGACVVALGHATSGLMTNNASLATLVKRASEKAGERVAELPMHPEYDICLRSDVADMKNIGDRAAGTISAAVFLREFVDDTPWVHLDIAGSGWNDQEGQVQIPSGPTGVPARTFVHLARLFAEM